MGKRIEGWVHSAYTAIQLSCPVLKVCLQLLMKHFGAVGILIFIILSPSELRVHLPLLYGLWSPFWILLPELKYSIGASLEQNFLWRLVVVISSSPCIVRQGISILKCHRSRGSRHNCWNNQLRHLRFEDPVLHSLDESLGSMLLRLGLVTCIVAHRVCALLVETVSWTAIA